MKVLIRKMFEIFLRKAMRFTDEILVLINSEECGHTQVHSDGGPSTCSNFLQSFKNYNEVI